MMFSLINVKQSFILNRVLLHLQPILLNLQLVVQSNVYRKHTLKKNERLEI